MKAKNHSFESSHTIINIAKSLNIYNSRTGFKPSNETEAYFTNLQEGGSGTQSTVYRARPEKVQSLRFFSLVFRTEGSYWLADVSDL